jgi:hypothetical protein
MVDSPTNNFATLNPLSHAINMGIALKEGNLTCGVSGESGRPRDVHSTLSVTTGKWYFETYLGNAAHGKIGIWNLDVYQERINAPENPVTSAFSDGEGWGFIPSNGNKEHAGSNQSWSSTPPVNSVIMTAFDMDAGKIWWGLNGTWLESGNPATGASAAYDEGALGFGTVVAVHSSNDGVVLTANFGQDSSFAGQKTAQGNQDSNDIGDFYYEPPSGFLAMCTSNLPDPAVIPSEHFNAVSYTGNASTNAITGVGFQPDFLWLKKGNGGHHFVFDAVRGVGKQLKPSNTGGETSHSNYLASFDTDGFTIGSDTDTNADGIEHISWSWKANGSGSANTSGDINSTVSANTDAGFSIISYTGNGSSNQNVGHGLSKRPEMVIYRNRTSDSKNWSVYHKDLNAADEGAFHQNLNLTDARGAASVIFNDQETTATTIPVGTSSDNNENGSSHIAYAFHSVDGFSRVGTYRGNGVTDGVFNYTGFRPAYVMLKCRNTSGGWNIIDNKREPYNPSDERAEAQAASAFDNHAAYKIDFLSNGFKLRGTSGEWNGSSNTFTYIAFAKEPFKYANAR